VVVIVLWLPESSVRCSWIWTGWGVSTVVVMPLVFWPWMLVVIWLMTSGRAGMVTVAVLGAPWSCVPVRVYVPAAL